MGIRYCTVERVKRKPNLKTFVLISLIILTTCGWFTFYTVKTNASNDIAKRGTNTAMIQSFSINQTKIMEVQKSKYLEEANKEDSAQKEKNISDQPPAPAGKTAYLTFDDGPSKTITPQVLDILKQYGVNASFFVIGKQCAYYPDIIREALSEGNTICNHTYTHHYKTIYSGVTDFEADVKKCDAEIKAILGDSYASKYVRFPGGGFGKKYVPFRSSIKKEGYVPVNWNIDTGDSLGKNVPAQKLLENVKYQLKHVPQGHEVIVLMHDMAGKQTTVEALPSIIEYLQSEGYTFAAFE